MQKKNWIIITSTILYSFLFYQQSAGINFLIFTLCLTFILLLQNKSLLKERAWCMLAFCSILSAVGIFLYGNTLSIFTNILSLSLLSVTSLYPRSTLIFSLLYASISPFFLLTDIFTKGPEEKIPITSSFGKKMGLIIIPLLITLVFFFMYRASNPIFNAYADKINFDFISFGLLLFSLGGFILMYAFYKPRNVKELSEFDNAASNRLSETHTLLNLFGKPVTIQDEVFSGTVLFVLLNILLLAVNLLDINFLIFQHALPEGVSLSEFVHQGIGILIVSIILAIVIILYYFRGAVNFYQKNTTIKTLAFAWIVQNAYMLFSTAWRNNMYIQEYGLSYKKIGVYVYLLLTLIGLITTFIKIAKIKSNMYLFRTNAWLFYTVLVFACVWNWDRIISDFNIHKAKWLEKNFLMKLSNENLSDLWLLHKDKSQDKRIYFLKEDEIFDSYVETRSLPDSFTPNHYFEKQINQRIYFFLREHYNRDWRSINLRNEKVYKKLVELNKQKQLLEIDLDSSYIEHLSVFKDFGSMEKMDLNGNIIHNMNEFSILPNLKHLELANNGIKKLNGIEKLTKLEYLDLDNNPIVDYAPLYHLKNLKEIHVRGIDPANLIELRAHFPNTIILAK